MNSFPSAVGFGLLGLLGPVTAVPTGSQADIRIVSKCMVTVGSQSAE